MHVYYCSLVYVCLCYRQVAGSQRMPDVRILSHIFVFFTAINCILLLKFVKFLVRNHPAAASCFSFELLLFSV